MQPARWGAKLEAAGTQAPLPVWDDASRHVSRTVRSRVRAHHQRDHRPIAPLGQRRRAGPVGCHDRLEAVAGAHRHEAPGLLREQLGDGPRVPPQQRHAGQDQRPAVDLLPSQPGRAVLPLDEAAQRRPVDVALVGVGREQDLGGVQDLATRRQVAAALALQLQPRRASRLLSAGYGVTLARDGRAWAPAIELWGYS